MKQYNIRNFNLNVETAIILLESKNIKEGPISSIRNIYDRLNPTDQQRINKAIIVKIADLFENPFANFLEKNLNKELRLVDLGVIINNAQKGDEDALNKVKYILLDSMLDYYESLLKSKMFKKTLTGDKTVDEAYSRAIADLFNSPEMINLFYDNIDSILRGKVEKIEDIEIFESNAKNAFRYVKSLGSKSKMMKYKISDKLLSYIPNVDKKLKKYIHNLVMNMDKKMMDRLHSRWDIRNVVNALSEPIVTYIHNRIENKYLNKNPDLKIFNRILKEVLKSDLMEEFFKAELLRLFNLRKLAEN